MQDNKPNAFHRADSSEQTTATAVSARKVGNKEKSSARLDDSLITDPKKGTPPSNTVPPNYIKDQTTILRYGIDSLYLSFSGSLSPDLEDKLVSLKLAAQSNEQDEKVTAQIKFGDHLFEVLGRGARRFPFILSSNFFQIQLSHHASDSLPIAYVQISSELLTFTPFKKIMTDINFIINSCGLVTGLPKISRVDLFADFVTLHEVKNWDSSVWVSRAEKTNAYSVKRKFTGWVIGEGSPISARLYNKTTEIEKSKKDYLKPIWLESGWNGIDPVWRLEFQLMREVLKELSTLNIETLLKHQNGLWRYATKDWLRLTVPNLKDSNQTRWPTHPIWEALQKTPFSENEQIILKRVNQERVPSDDSPFINGLGGITSFMAKNGITELDEGFGEFIAAADRFHQFKGRKKGTGLKQYISGKVKEKGRKFNSIDNRLRTERKSELAKAYRKGKYDE